jgi:hypothetical protein
MPGLKVAVANGNWSSTSTWSGGVLPVAGDIVASNGFTVTIDQNINVDSLTNAAQSIVTATAAMTGYSTPTGYLVEASNYQEPAWQAFDRNGSSRAWVQNLPLWISYTFPSAIIIDSYRLDMYTSNLYAMQNFTFEGWNGTSWVVLHTVTGNSLTTYISPSIGNTTAYIKYRFHCTSTSGTAGVIYQEISLYELGYGSAAVAGGGFILNDGVTVTCTNATNGIAVGSVTCLTIAAVSPAVVNVNANVNSSATSIVKSGNCTLNVTGLLQGNNNAALSLNTNTGTTNVVGEIRKSAASISSVGILHTGTGNTINITGNLTYTSSLGGGNIKKVLTSSGSCNINITGNLVGSLLSANADFVLIAGTNDIINITGNVLGTAGFVGGTATITGGAFYLNVIGQIIAGSGGPAINNTNASAIIILTGPFISDPTGIQPLWISRMHYRRTMGSYFEFRDNSTNGALPPAASAPATRLVSPDTVADSPIPANVRQGTSYAAGSQIGTMIVPSRDNVAKGVLVDNTTGTAILDADAIWAVPLTSINTLNSIGRRVKNAATVETTGAQIQTTLNNNE